MLRTGDLMPHLFKRSKDYKELGAESLSHLKKVMLMIADDFIDVCEKYELIYMLAFGSALGAIRHKGFIPWDDDLDFYMPRKDYIKFLNIANQELGDKYWIVSTLNSVHAKIPTCQIRLKHTRYINYGDLVTASSEPDYQRGIYIDIFPLDNCSDTRINRIIDGSIIMKNMFERSCIFTAQAINILEKKGVTLTDDEQKILIFKLKIGKKLEKNLSYESRIMANDRFVSRYTNSNSEYVMCYDAYPGFRRSVFPRTDLLPPSKGQFEGREWYVPSHPENYLKRIYGEYMKLPPVEMRKVHPVFELNFGKY